MNGDGKAVADPDNVPPQSRLFIVVPKTSDGTLIEVSFSIRKAAYHFPAVWYMEPISHFTAMP